MKHRIDIPRPVLTHHLILICVDGKPVILTMAASSYVHSSSLTRSTTRFYSGCHTRILQLICKKPLIQLVLIDLTFLVNEYKYKFPVYMMKVYDKGEIPRPSWHPSSDPCSYQKHPQIFPHRE